MYNNMYMYMCMLLLLLLCMYPAGPTQPRAEPRLW